MSKRLCVTCEHMRKGVCGRYPPPWPEVPEEACGEYKMRWAVQAMGLKEPEKPEVSEERQTLNIPDIVKDKLDVPVPKETVRE